MKIKLLSIVNISERTLKGKHLSKQVLSQTIKLGAILGTVNKSVNKTKTPALMELIL